MFVDRVKIKLKAGDGGNGIVAFRREKYVPLGGPSGGDGGKGGDIIFLVDTHKSTLLDLRYNKKLVAEDGGVGKPKKMHGADGKDVIVHVPAGTMVFNAETNALIADLVNPGQEAVICKGGRGGRGNWHFASGRNNAPEYSEHGEPGEAFDVQLELKLLADVGVIGFPSVGKSTLLSVVSKAKPEIADYPFTTIQPNLGVVQVKDGRSFVMADLPGLIEGASLGKGLGDQFLRHIERCRVLIHVIDMSGSQRNPIDDYRIINEELKNYQMRLLERPQVIVANKMDEVNAEENLEKFKQAYPDLTVYPCMTLLHEGIEEVLYQVADLLETTPQFPMGDEEESQDCVLYTFTPKAPDFTVANLGNGRWQLSGQRVERLFKTINFEQPDNVYRFATMLRKMGVDEALKKAGAQEGDLVYIEDYEFEYVD